MREYLQVGERSPRVAEVRTALARLGLMPGYAGDAVQQDSPQWSGDDDLFDEELRDALLAFQQSRGICADGVIRDSTLKTLREASYVLGARVLSHDPLAPMTGLSLRQGPHQSAQKSTSTGLSDSMTVGLKFSAVT